MCYVATIVGWFTTHVAVESTSGPLTFFYLLVSQSVSQESCTLHALMLYVCEVIKCKMIWDRHIHTTLTQPVRRVVHYTP